MSTARIAISLASTLPVLLPTLALVGCGSDPEPVAEVPPPAAVAEPEPLPPVSINEGSTIGQGTPPGVTVGPGAGDPGAGYQPPPVPPTPPATQTYTIRKGDTLWSIATRTYGNGQRWKDIAQANPSIDPKKLAIGQQIILP